MEKATKQQAFETAVRGIAAQGWKKAGNDTGRCLYRTEEGLKCAVGHLIPDDKYEPAMDARSLSYALSKIGIEQEPGDGVWTFYNDLQGAHDGFSHRDRDLTMRERLQQFATKYNLTFPEGL